jgi:hypothetical protein
MAPHPSITQLVELVGQQRELPLTPGLCAEAAVPVLAAELFQLVVQASHGVN